MVKCGVFLPKSVFGHGQLYVALSRVSSKAGLKVMILNVEDEQGKFPNKDGTYTKNIVYGEMFDD